MTQLLDNRLPGSLDPEDEDTLELELSPEQMRMLESAAAEAERTREPVPALPAPTPVRIEPMPIRLHQPTLSTGKALALVKAPALRAQPRGRWRGLRIAAVLGVAAAMVSVSGVAYLAKAHPPIAGAAGTAFGPTAAVPLIQSPPVETPVFFRNPFDATEVFEFPPGTSEDDARDAVAERLLERARERQRPSVKTAHITVTAGDSARR